MAIGGGALAGSNLATATQFGVEVSGIALLANLAFQFLKTFDWFDQHRWWSVTLLVICIGSFLGIRHEHWDEAIWKGGAAAFQAAANYASQKSAGLGILEPAPNQGG